MGKLSFVTGKGGVGKSRSTVALASHLKMEWLAQIHQGGIETEIKKSGLQNLHILNFSRSELYKDFIASGIKIPFLSGTLANSQLFHNLLQLAPNLYELLLLNRWIHQSQKRNLMIDSPSSGNFLNLLECIKVAKSVFDGGLMRKLADEVEDYWKSQIVDVYIVSIPEQSSLDESQEIQRALSVQYPHWKIYHLLNRLHDEDSTDGLCPELIRLAVERPKKERERIAGWHFDFTLKEGAFHL